jgi:hypothetical protein
MSVKLPSAIFDQQVAGRSRAWIVAIIEDAKQDHSRVGSLGVQRLGIIPLQWAGTRQRIGSKRQRVWRTLGAEDLSGGYPF